MFQKYDQDGNGGIDKREFHLLLQELGFFKDMTLDKQQKVSLLPHSASAGRIAMEFAPYRGAWIRLHATSTQSVLPPVKG
jgi:hypothetical protein